MLRATCSAGFHKAVDQTATIPRTREFPRDPGEQHTLTRKNVCSRQNCQPRVTFDAPKPDTRTAFNKDGEKHDQRENSRVATFVKCPTKDVLQFRVKRRVYMSCTVGPGQTQAPRASCGTVRLVAGLQKKVQMLRSKESWKWCFGFQKHVINEHEDARSGTKRWKTQWC